jgi:Concanavalin A-like lectin/glucanases superfamily
MTVYKHIDFQIPGWGEFPQGPQQRPGYRSEVLADSPLIYLRLGESAGPTAIDETGQRNATEIGAMSWGLSGALGLDSDTAVGSSGTGGLRVNTTGWLPIGSSARTIELWFRPTANPNAFRGVSYGSTASGTHLTYIYTTTSMIVSAGSSGFGAIATNTINQWHHTAIVFPAGATRLDEFLIYRNGAPVSTQTFYGLGSTPVNTSDSALHINMDETGGFYNCDIDELAIYDTSLSAVRIKAHYDSALGLLEAI